jgi:hypothetical protein
MVVRAARELHILGPDLIIPQMRIRDNQVISDAFAKTRKMAKQKFRPTRLGGFSGAKAYI